MGGRSSGRGQAQSVGAILVIVVAVVSMGVPFYWGAETATGAPPDARFDVKYHDGEYRLVHEGGATFDGDRIVIRGVEQAPAAVVPADEPITIGTAIPIDPAEETITVHWIDREGETHAVASLPVPTQGFAGEQVQTSYGAINGTVTAAGSGTPIPNATITVEVPSLSAGLQTTTDADGTFRLLGVPPGARTVQITAEGYGTEPRSITVTESSKTTLTVELPPTNATASDSQTGG